MNYAYLNNRKASNIEIGIIVLFSMAFILPSISVNINFLLLLGAVFLYLFYVLVKDIKTIANFAGILFFTISAKSPEVFKGLISLALTTALAICFAKVSSPYVFNM